jgi:hypothetical protein
MPKIDLYDAELLKTAYDIGSRGWSRKFGAGEWLELRLDVESYPYYAAPALDEESEGVAVACGEDALRKLAQAGAAADGEAELPSIMGFRMTPAEELSSDARGLLRRAGLPDPTTGLHPQFHCTRSGKKPRTLNRDERRTLLLLLKALVDADDRGELRAAAIGSGEEASLLLVTGDALAPVVASLTTELRDAPDEHWVLDDAELAAAGFEVIDSDAADEALADDASWGPDRPPPAPDDLAGWIEADRRTSARIAIAVSKSLVDDPEATQAFFGRDCDDVFGDDARPTKTAALAFGEWCFVARRRTAGASTAAERESELTTLAPAERALIAARMGASTSLLSVTALRDDGGLDVCDAATGAAATCYDPRYGARYEVGEAFVTRVYAAGAFRFVAPISPSFYGAEVEDLAAELRALGAGRDFEFLDARPELAGGLFDLAEQLGAPSGPGAPPAAPGGTVGELSPAMRDALGRHLLRNYDMWADEALPELDGKSPRRAARTASGRRALRPLVDALAAACGPHAVALRRRFYRELGLDQ